MKLLKKFGLHEAGEDIQVNETLEKHLIRGGFVEKPEKPVKKAKK